MHRNFRKITAWLLCVCMLVGILPVGADSVAKATAVEQKIDFRGWTAPKTATIAANGWEINEEKTDVATYVTNAAWIGGNQYGINIMLPRTVGAQYAIDFQVEHSGVYTFEIEYSRHSSAGIPTEAYIDDVKLGVVNFKGEITGYTREQSIAFDDTQIELEAGSVHTLTFKRTDTVEYCTYPSALVLKPYKEKSIEISRAKAVECNKSVAIKVSDQNGADVTENVSFSAEPEGIVEISDDGIVTGIADGIAKIIATLSSSEGNVTSEEYAIEVISEGGKNQTVSFRGSAAKDPRNATIVENGWKINKKETSVGAYTTYPQWLKYLGEDGLTVYIPQKDGSVESDLAIDFSVDESGLYNVDMECVTHAAGNIADIYIDGMYIGEVDFYSPSMIGNVKKNVSDKVIALNKGTHTLTIRRTSKNKYECFYPSALILRPEITEVYLDCPELIPTDTPVELKVIDQGGNPVDEKITYSVEPKGIITVGDDGKMIGVAAGNVSITASVVVNGETLISEPESVTVVVDDGKYKKIDLRGSIENEIRDATIKLNGFKINKDKTSTGTYTTYPQWLEWEEYGIFAYIPGVEAAPNSDVAIDFTVDKTGVYILELEYTKNAAGNVADVYLDGMLIGDLDFYSSSAQHNKRITYADKKVALLEGEHTLTFRRTSKNKYECIYPSAIVLRAPQKVKLCAAQTRMEYGTTAQLSLAGPWFEDTENIPTDDNIFFQSSDLSVLEVTDNGLVRAKYSGTATVTVTVLNGDESDYDSLDITVTDNSDIVSAYLSGSNIVYINNQSKLNVSVTRESGDLLDAANAHVVYQVTECEPADAITVSDDGMVTAICEGTAKIKASVTANNVTVESNEITIISKGIEIPDGEYADHIFDFRNNQIGTPKDAVIASHGWQMVRDVSNPGFITNPTWFSYTRYGMMIYTPGTSAPTSDLALDVVVKADGIYRGKFEFLHDAEAAIYAVFVDGKYMGSIETYSPEGVVEAEPVFLNSIYLEKGVHRVVFRFMSGHPYLFMSAFSLLKVDAPSEAEIIVEAEKDKLVKGEVISTEIGVFESGMPVKFGKDIYGNTNDYLNITLSDPSVISYDAMQGKITALKEGECNITIAAKYGTTEKNEVLHITVDDQKLHSVTINKDKETLNQGDRVGLSVTAYTESGRTINPESINLTWSSLDERFIRIEDGELICVAPGEAEISVTAQMGEETVFAVTMLTVGEAVGANLVLSANTYMLKLSSNGIQINAIGILSNGIEVAVEEIVYENNSSDIVTVSDDGFVAPKAEGKATVTVHGLVAGKQCTAEISFMVTVGKTESTIYTPKKVAVARENVNKYSWARSEKDSAVYYADRYLEAGLDAIWDSVTTQGLMRNANPGHKYDPTLGYCHYCGKNLKSIHGHYPWLIDPVNSPWKIQCPECRRRFPSNDFGSFYKLGIDEKGNWNYDLAVAENQKLVAAGEDGYLKNILYPEATKEFGDANWGVDDGFGYDTRIEFQKGFTQKHQYIAYYNLWGLWYTGANMYYTGAYIPAMLTSFMNAYIYTGDAKYGRAGAILIDRIADVYPDMRYDEHLWYYHSDTTPIAGKIVDHIWGTNHARHFAEYYDAFFSAMDDTQVISFLNKKAEQYGMPNKKEDAFEIRRNCEDNLLRSTYTNCVKGRLNGNFGMHQNAMATAAVVLDNQSETHEMIDWIFRSNSDIRGIWWKNETTGGDFYKTLMNIVSRDGIGNEASPGYNYLWVSNTIPIANTLAGYKGYETADLYKNPKFIKLLIGQMPLIMCRRGTPQIGDDGGGAAGIGITLSRKDMIKAYEVTGKKEFAQIAYLLNGNSSKNLRGDIFTENPQNLSKDIQSVIDEHGEYEFLDKSIQLGEYGISILRDGGYYYNSDGTVVDNQRDFWIYYGFGRGHGHPDALNLGMEAFGLNIAPEMGYPTLTSGDEFSNWNHTTVSHNTVVVDNASQYGLYIAGKPLHFDDSKHVKVMDIDASEAYNNTSIYRRTHVVVKVNDDVSYSVDFFRIRGGNDHLYSFHSQSQNVKIEGVTLRAQTSGSYAGTNIAWKTAGMSNGYSYLNNVSRATAPGTGQFSADFDVDDSWGILKQKRDIHLRMTMLNDFDLTEVATADGPTPDVGARMDSFKYVLARRSGRNLDSLFTTVFEPYDGERYLLDMKDVSINCVGQEKETSTDKAKAVRIEHQDGRVDYICYATNNQVTYEVDNYFIFKGAIGVYSVKDGNVIFQYVLDGEQIDELEAVSSVEGTVVDFTDVLDFENSITIDFDSPVDANKLVGKYVDVNNGLAVNGVYRICNARNISEKRVQLDIGDTTLISGYVDSQNIYGGYTFNIAIGNRARIPLSATVDNSVVFSPIPDQKITEGKKLEVQVIAESPTGADITFSGNDLPRGASVDDQSGTFTWTPDSKQVGNYNIAIDAEANGVKDTIRFKVEVIKSIGSAGAESGTDTGEDAGAGGGGAAGGGGTFGGDTTEPDDTKPDDTETGDNTGSGTGTGDEGERFIDLGNHDWAKEAIYYLADLGVVNGTSYNTYSPAANIKRADFAIMLVRAFGITEGKGENFADVDASKYYAEELRLAKANGIVVGIGENKFNPEGEITRQDMMVMLSRALKAQGKELAEADESVLSQFADAAQISDYAKSAVTSVVESGIIAGSNGRINPLEKATRAEIAVMLSRVLAK